MNRLEFKTMKEEILEEFEFINEFSKHEKYDIVKIEKFLDKHEDTIIQFDEALKLGESYDSETTRIKKNALKDIIENFIDTIKNNNNEIGSILDTVMLENVINLIFNYLLHSDVKQYAFETHYRFRKRPYERYNFVTYSYITTWLYNNGYSHFCR